MSRVTSQCLEQFGWSACGSPRLNKEIRKKKQKTRQSRRKSQKSQIEDGEPGLSFVPNFYPFIINMVIRRFPPYQQIWIVNCQLFQSAPMVLNSHRERDNFQVHLCCKFTPNFANARSVEIQIIRNRC